MTTNSKIYEVTRRFSVGELITLFQIDLTKFGGSVYYFTNNIFEEHIPIIFGQKEYYYLPIAVENIDIGTDSGPAQPRLTIATAGGPVQALISQYKDLRGAKVTRIRTFAEFLDQIPDGTGGVIVNPGADSTAVLPIDYFVVDRKVASNKTMAEFQLTAPIDQDGVQIPLRVIKKRYCDLVYRRWDGTAFTYNNTSNPCPWGKEVSDGGNYFDVYDEPCTAAEDRCSKTIGGCVLRFGKDRGLPFGGFPGVKSAGELG